MFSGCPLVYLNALSSIIKTQMAKFVEDLHNEETDRWKWGLGSQSGSRLAPSQAGSSPFSTCIFLHPASSPPSLPDLLPSGHRWVWRSGESSSACPCLSFPRSTSKSLKVTGPKECCVALSAALGLPGTCNHLPRCSHHVSLLTKINLQTTNQWNTNTPQAVLPAVDPFPKRQYRGG